MSTIFNIPLNTSSGGSGGSVLSVNNQFPDGSGNVYLDINHIPMNPSLKVYIDSKNGVDAIGRGQAVTPYKTLNYALSQITDNNLYQYQIDANGVFTEVNWTLKPNISYQFNNSQLTISGTVSLDSSWSTGGFCSVEGLYNSSFVNGATFDFNAINAGLSIFQWLNINTTDNNLITIIGNSNGTTIAIVEGMQGFTNQESLQIQNCYGAISKGAPANVTIIHDSETTASSFRIDDLQILGELTVTDNTTSGLSFFVSNSLCSGEASFTELGNGTLLIPSTGTRYLNPPSLQCTSPGVVDFRPDFITALPVLIGDATFTPKTIADGMSSNYPSPLNFVYPSGDESVHGAIEGIDNALTSTGSSPIELLYIDSINGNDSTGAGTIQKPYLTYEMARSTAVVKGASSTMPFSIIPIGIFNITGDMTISPFVNILGQGIYQSQFNVSGQALLDVSWGTLSNPTCVVKDCNIAAIGNIALDRTVYQANSLLILNNVTFEGTSIVEASGSGTQSDAEIIVFVNCTTLINGPLFNITNLSLVLLSSSIASGLTFVNSSTVSSLLAVIQNCTGFDGNITLSATSSGTILSVISASPGLGSTFNIDGTNISVAIDSASYDFVPVLTSGATISQISLISLSDGINVSSFSPVNYSPIGSSSYLINSITAHLAGIDAELGTLLSDLGLQGAYDIESGISLSPGRIFSVHRINPVADTNAIVIQSVGTSTLSTYRVMGWKFTPAYDLVVDALQYDDVHFTQPGTRECGIYRVSDQFQMADAFVAKTDPLDATNKYRTHAITPVTLLAGVEYVYACVVAANESSWGTSNAIPNASLVITQFCQGASSSSLIPLSYPTVFLNGSTVYVGSFQFSTATYSEVGIQDDSIDPRLIKTSSTTQSSQPFPVMTSNQYSLIAPVIGSGIFNSDEDTYEFYDGINNQLLATQNWAKNNIQLQDVYNASSGGGSYPALVIMSAGASITFYFPDGSQIVLADASLSSLIFALTSTTQLSQPFPVMTDAQYNAITQVVGAGAYDSDFGTFAFFDGMGKQLLATQAYVNGIINNPGVVAYYQNTSNILTFSAISYVPVSVAVTADNANLSNTDFSLNPSTGLVTYTGPGGIFRVSWTASIASSSGLPALYYLTIGRNGTAITSCEQYMTFGSSSVTGIPITINLTLYLNNGDTLQPYVRPNANPTTWPMLINTAYFTATQV